LTCRANKRGGRAGRLYRFTGVRGSEAAVDRSGVSDAVPLLIRVAAAVDARRFAGGAAPRVDVRVHSTLARAVPRDAAAAALIPLAEIVPICVAVESGGAVLGQRERGVSAAGEQQQRRCNNRQQYS